MINRKPIDLDCRDCSHFAAWGIGINNSGQIVGNYGTQPLASTPAEYAAEIDSEERKWSALVKSPI
jgi:hypothetical protein